MKLVSIDIGSFSIKAITFKISKGITIYESTQEIFIDHSLITEQKSLLDIQLEEVQQFVEREDEQEVKYFFNLPNHLYSQRFVTLPVKNKSKAELMIPFQLEEDIPFSLSQSHISSSLRPIGNQFEAHVQICSKEEFSQYFNKVLSYQLSPKLVSSQESVVANFIYNSQEIFPESFAIMDIGHYTTNVYFFKNKKLISSHKSYIAGHSIDTAISDSYGIDMHEASIYKHQNSFFLLEEQYKEVNEEQRLFAKLMDQVFSPLINEFQIWKTGSQIQSHSICSHLYLTGGSANIKNIHTYLKEKFVITISDLECFKHGSDDSKIDKSVRYRAKFSMASMLAQGYKTKSKLINFFHGEYSIKGQFDLPVDSMVFIANRVALISLIFLIGFGIERFSLSGQMKEVKAELNSIAKNGVLDLSNKQKRYINLGPRQVAQVIREISKKQKDLVQEIKTIQASTQINALAILHKVGHVVKGINGDVILFQAYDSGEFTINIRANDSAAMDKIRQLLEVSFNDITVDENKTKLLLNINGNYKVN